MPFLQARINSSRLAVDIFGKSKTAAIATNINPEE